MRPPMQALFDQLPPHSLESEMSLLGSVILESKIIDELQGEIDGPEVFYSEAHSEIYRSMIRCYDRNHGRLDIVLLSEAMSKRESLEPVGGSDYLLNLAQSVPSAASWKYYAGIVRDHHRRRRAIEELGDALHKITRPDAVFDDIMPSVCDKLSDLAAETGQEQVHRTGDVAREIARRIKSGEKPSVIPSGLPTLDKMLKGNGFRRGQFVGLGGRPANGKSMLGANLAVNASERGFKTAFVSLEMDPEEIVERWMAFYGYSESDARCELKHLDLAVEMMENHDIPVIDVPNAELANIRSHVRSIRRKRGLDMVVIDYLQLIRVAGLERQFERVTYAANAMKLMAREYNIVNLCLFQLNREGGKKERPSMSDGKGSGEIEQAVDTMLLIHNPPDSDEEPELIMAKQRRGRTGTVMVDCVKTQSRFIDKGEKTWTESKGGLGNLPI